MTNTIFFPYYNLLCNSDEYRLPVRSCTFICKITASSF